MNIKERLIHFAKSQHISISKLERLSGLSNGYIKNTKGNPTVPKLEGVLRAFPRLSRNWLINGTGPMLLPKPAQPDIEEFVDDLTSLFMPADGFEYPTPDTESTQSEIDYLKKIISGMQEEINWYEEQITTLLSIIENLTRK